MWFEYRSCKLKLYKSMNFKLRHWFQIIVQISMTKCILKMTSTGRGSERLFISDNMINEHM
jgi:hypothetical protein